MAGKPSNVALVAQLLGVTERKLYQLAEEGIIPPSTKGAGYDVSAVVMHYIAHLRDPKQRFKFNAKELADHVGITEAMVLKLAREEGMPKVKRGEYNGSECVQWMLSRLRKKAMGEDVSDITEENKLLKREQRQFAALKRKKLEGTVVRRSDAQDGYLLLAGLFVSQLEAIPGRICSELAGIDEPSSIRIILKREFGSIREQLEKKLRSIASSIS